VLDRAIRELLPITRKVLAAVVEPSSMTIGASMRAARNCSRAVLWSWLGARITRSKEPPRPVGGQVRLLPRPGLRPLLVDQLRLETTAAYRVPAPEVLPLAEQLHEADVQRVLDAVDERL
jgi:hypothetical protein